MAFSIAWLRLRGHIRDAKDALSNDPEMPRMRDILGVLWHFSVLLTFNFLFPCKESEFDILATFVFSRI